MDCERLLGQPFFMLQSLGLLSALIQLLSAACVVVLIVAGLQFVFKKPRPYTLPLVLIGPLTVLIVEGVAHLFQDRGWTRFPACRWSLEILLLALVSITAITETAIRRKCRAYLPVAGASILIPLTLWCAAALLIAAAAV